MKSYLLGVVAAAALSATGCQTVNDQAPLEVQQAAQAVKAAKAADVEDYMPRAMEAAKRKLDRSVSLLKDSTDYSKDGIAGEAKGTQSESIKLAIEAKRIADGGVKIVNDMQSYDSNSGAYLAVADRAARADQIQADLTAAKAHSAELEQKLAALTADNAKLASRPVEETIPAGFRVGKPIAYFASGSVVLGAKYRADIEELANLLKKNSGLQVKLEGFADPRGSAEKNRVLAEKRLQVVADQLKAQGVDSNKVQLVTVGATADQSAARGAHGGELQLDRKVTATITSATTH